MLARCTAWVRSLSREEKRLVWALVFLFIAATFCIVNAVRAADAPTPATAIIPPYHHWMLSNQDFNARTGLLIGRRRSFPCRAHWDYLHGIIKVASDCSKTGYYETAQECSLAQSGRLAKTRRIQSEYIGIVWFCYHPGDRLGGV